MFITQAEPCLEQQVADAADAREIARSLESIRYVRMHVDLARTLSERMRFRPVPGLGKLQADLELSLADVDETINQLREQFSKYAHAHSQEVIVQD